MIKMINARYLKPSLRSNGIKKKNLKTISFISNESQASSSQSISNSIQTNTDRDSENEDEKE